MSYLEWVPPVSDCALKWREDLVMKWDAPVGNARNKARAVMATMRENSTGSLKLETSSPSCVLRSILVLSRLSSPQCIPDDWWRVASCCSLPAQCLTEAKSSRSSAILCDVVQPVMMLFCGLASGRRGGCGNEARHVGKWALLACWGAARSLHFAKLLV